MNSSHSLRGLVLAALVLSSAAKGQESASETKTAPHMVVVQMRVLELDDAKLRDAGIDYQVLDERVKFSTKDGGAALPLSVTNSFVKDRMARELGSPSLAFRTNGQPAQFRVGGETPVRYYKYIMYKRFGTVVDMTATMIDEGHVRLAVDYQHTDLDISRAPALPSFPYRRCQMTCDMELGQRIAVPVSVTPTQGKQVRPTVMLMLVEKFDSPFSTASR